MGLKTDKKLFIGSFFLLKIYFKNFIENKYFIYEELLLVVGFPKK